MAGAPDQVDLLEAFTSFNSFRAMMTNYLLPALDNANSAAAAVLALEGLYRIEKDVKGDQFDCNDAELKKVRKFLRKWRCESPLHQAYGGAFKRVKIFLEKLSIFKTFDVPLFIDDFGKKKLMSDYGDQNLEIIDINLDTPIVHVTHTVEKNQIVLNQKFKPSDNKNIIKGVWFSPKSQLSDPPSSVYGSWVFETTLRSSSVRGIRQGEIVSYQNEVNFILYASDKRLPDPAVVKKATDEAVTKLPEKNANAYAAVSIFVPYGQEFWDMFKVPAPFQILHGDFCVRGKRTKSKCTELD